MITQYKRVLAVLSGTSLFVLFMIMLTTTISRYFFNTSILWGEELSKYSMIYGVMFATSLCYLEDLHIKFAILDNLKSTVIKKALAIVIDLSVFASSIILIYSGYLFVMKRGFIESPGIGVHMYYFQSALIIGGIALCLASSMKLIQHVTNYKRAPKLSLSQSDV
ncbi:TRAP transporter small permease subunit [Vibrio sp. SS-MA-C1-2]|uniref:TRAP transporter small permease n=1 Tax=Vibrio sp. SS-MA-C1-2 TaxID=2908646 RepID=UPI001F1E48A1|nr:TRAP transporter small permease subunit [Vibrio sp. SS-MA-C1-2]UJF17857.1 TRAP transporter small permease subunit [Vibrio sp. SS-MA-C1-2]